MARVEDQDPLIAVRQRAAKRLTQDILSKIKPDDKDLLAESNSPYTIGNVLWLTAAMVVFRIAEVPEAFLYDPRKNWWYFILGSVLISVNVCLCLFCVIWLSMVRKVDSSLWEKEYPSIIPVATGSFILGAILLTVGMWPIWRYFTPPILFTLFMGIIVLVAMLPDWNPARTPKPRDEIKTT